MIDETIDRLIAVFAQAGLPIGAPGPEVEVVLTEMSAALTPMRLPSELVTFWRRVDPQTVSLGPYPRLTSPSFALQSWRMHNDDVGVPVPRLMFPLCYESHGFLFVDLSSAAVFGWGYGGTPFELKHRDVAAYLDQLATMVELGEWRWVEADSGTYLEFDPDQLWDDIASVRLTGAEPIDPYGNQRLFDEDVRNWPADWLAANGIREDDRTPRGATTTVAALVAEAARGRDAAGTIHALVRGLGGGGNLGYQLTVDDGTGSLHIWCPPGLSPYGPSMRARFELDVLVYAGPVARPDTGGLHREIIRSAFDGDLPGANAAAMELFSATFDTPKSAIVTGLRPLD